MEITVSVKSKDGMSPRDLISWKLVKRQLEPILVVGAFALGTAWFVAFFVAAARWADYGNSEAGWIVIWLIVTGAWGGLFAYWNADAKK